MRHITRHKCTACASLSLQQQDRAKGSEPFSSVYHSSKRWVAAHTYHRSCRKSKQSALDPSYYRTRAYNGTSFGLNHSDHTKIHQNVDRFSSMHCCPPRDHLLPASSPASVYRRDRAEPAKTPRASCCATTEAPREPRQATQSQR